MYPVVGHTLCAIMQVLVQIDILKFNQCPWSMPKKSGLTDHSKPESLTTIQIFRYSFKDFNLKNSSRFNLGVNAEKFENGRFFIKIKYSAVYFGALPRCS